MTRDASTDIARGIAIIAIVVGHVLRIDGVPLDPFWDRLLYMFHLSVFALLSGLFVRGAVERMGRGGFIQNRSVHFLYLYAIWTLLQGLIDGGATLELLWFLPFLIEMTVLVAVVRPWRSIRRAIITLSLVGLFSIATWGLSGPVVGTQGLGISVFFVLAAVVGAERYLRFLRAVPGWMLVALLVLGAGVMVSLVGFTDAVPPASGGDARTLPGVALGVLASTAGVLAVVAASRLLSLLPRATAWLGYAGSHSLEIFLGHFAVLSILVAAPLVVQVVAGVGLPLLLGWVCRVIRFPWLFAAPAGLDGSGSWSGRSPTRPALPPAR